MGLTGSANLSTNAMLTAATAGGNIELSVLEEVATPVWPEPGFDPSLLQSVTDCNSLSTAARTSRQGPPPGLPILQSAVWDGGGLLLELAHKSPAGIELQARNHPLEGGWRTVGVLPEGVTTYRLTVSGIDDGAQLRLVRRLPGDDGFAGGPPVPATNLSLATRPPLGGAGHRGRVAHAGDLLGDELAYLNVFGDQLAALAAERRTSLAARPSTPRTTPAQGVSATSFNEQVLAWRGEQTARTVHGSAIGAFALGLPPGAPTEGWEDFDESAG